MPVFGKNQRLKRRLTGMLLICQVMKLLRKTASFSLIFSLSRCRIEINTGF